MEANTFPITVYRANCCGNSQNCLYPYEESACTEDELQHLFAWDHTFIRFLDKHRNREDFRCTKYAVFDCDNDHSEKQEEWITPDKIQDLFPKVQCCIYTSRNNNKQKGTKSARPRFHVIFPIDPITAVDFYTAFMRKVQAQYPFFDKNALDGGRFFYGNPDTQVQFLSGTNNLTQFISEKESAQAFAELGVTIPEGSRNNTVYNGTVKILKRWGENPKAYQLFLELADKCDPPLDQAELYRIWNSARKFYRTTVIHDPSYQDPDSYNSSSTVHWDRPIPFTQHALPNFPVDALPDAIRDYVLAISESTQTPIDMGATAALAILALCAQGKFRIRGKADWTEPLNLFTVIVAEPSERKSAVINFMTKPINAFEAEYNRQHAAELESSKMKKRILERRQRALEDKAAKGKIEDSYLKISSRKGD